MIAAVRTCFAKYFTFSGRARRAEYWWFVLFVVLVSIVLAIVDAVLFGTSPAGEDDGEGPLQAIFGLLTLIPMLAVGWRRLHDIGRSGWFLLLPYATGAAFALLMISDVALIGVAEEATGGATSAGGGFVTGAVIATALGVIAILVTWVLLTYWLASSSEPQENRFGPVPPA